MVGMEAALTKGLFCCWDTWVWCMVATDDWCKIVGVTEKVAPTIGTFGLLDHLEIVEYLHKT